MGKIYRLYIDESGDHAYGKKDLKSLRIKSDGGITSLKIDDYPELKKEEKRYLGLTGCIVETEAYASSFYPKLEELKQKHFPHDPDDVVILHRKEIINKESHFWRLRDPQKEGEFNADILKFLQEQEYKVITVVIDKMAHIERYQGFAYHPYHFCLSAMLERYCGFLYSANANGDVMAESRGGEEDRKLKEAYQNIYNTGNLFRESSFFQSVLTSKEIKIKLKDANIAGIQIADLIAFPSKQRILVENKRASEPDKKIFGGKVCEIIESKYNNYNGKVKGYGKVFIK